MNLAGRALKVLSRGVAACLTALALLASEHHGQVKFVGLPVPGATVTASQNGTRFATVTNEQGVYSFPDLSDGTWTIQIELQGFATIRQDVSIAPNASATDWDLKMLTLDQMHAQVQAAPSTPTPIPAQAAPSTNAGAAPRSRNSRTAPPAPANTPTPFQRSDLNAAPTVPGDAAAPPGDQLGNAGAAADLSQRASDGLLINGSANNGAISPFGLSPAFGNNRLGARSLYNGNIGLLFDDSALDARPFSLTGQNTPRPDYHNLTGVASFGGPLNIPHLVRNGPNVVINYQWTRRRNASTQTGLMPTQAQRLGDLSQTSNTIFEPGSSVPFSGNQIPIASISPQARALLNLYPLPNFAGSTHYNYQIPVVGITHQDSLQSRVNKAFRKDQFFGNLAYQSTRSDNPNIFQYLDTSDSAGINTGVNWRHVFTSRFSVILGGQFSRLSTRITPYFENRQNISGAAGILGNNQAPVNWGPPSLIFSGGTQQLSDGQASFNRNLTSAVTLSSFWNHASHNVTLGFDFRRQQFNDLAQQNPRGTFTFTGASTGSSVSGLSAAGTGSDFADFLLGIPDTVSIAYGNADKYFRSSAYDAYFTDDWRVNTAFTLNAGIRWEYGSPMTELYGRLVNLDIAPGFAAAAPVLGSDPSGSVTRQQFPSSLIRPDRHGFEPRIGLAWRPLPASSVVVRAGYGVYYNSSVYQTIAMQMAQQSPLSTTLSLQNSPANPLTLANGFNATPSTVPNTFAIDPNFRVGYAQNWQTSIQRDLPGSLVMIATYQGAKGTRGVQEFLPNTYPLGATNPCPACPAGFVYMTSNGNSTREAGLLELRRRLHNGVTATLQYTYSKSIDDAALGGRGQGSSVIAQNWLDLSAERGLSNFDQRQLVNFQMQYSTGMGVCGGTLLSGWKGALFKEWTVTSQTTFGSGLPLTPIYLAAVNGTGVTGSIRPNYTGAPLYAAPPGLYLNPAAYAAPAPGQWGNAGRDSITGPTQFNVNASLGRVFRLNDRLNFEFRFDATNILNHVNFTSWNTMAGSAQFGLPAGVNPPRSMQTTLRLRF